MKVSDSRVLLTGANGGIGQAVATALAGAGASVMLAGRSPARLSALARTLQQRHPDSPVDWREVELDQAASIAALANHAAAWNCNVIVHCAGVAEFGHFEATGVDRISQVLHTNLLAPMVLTQSLLPHLRTLPRAQVICVGSVLGAIGLPGFSVYCASKFGLRGFAQALRRELSSTPVRVQYLGPRSTRTAFNSAAVNHYNQATGTAMDPPEQVATALLDMLESGAAERFLGFPEKFAARLNGTVPTWLDGAFDKHRASLPTRPDQPDPSTPSTIQEIPHAH
ncbi:SDR family oxidoreductase [uncultured Hydrogenophaga sp.]|uniref:SDR family oxidoreductase n=1 Tax=uncultured Hydrogenophaga sp. TaxID=199683 RepID=UPI00265DF0E6|nr:SDR family oxidoreductase [uncultured Hydrogenophaga sp.]